MKTPAIRHHLARLFTILHLAAQIPRADAAPNLIDPSFDPGIGLNTEYPEGEGLAVAIAADGGVLVGGAFSAVAGQRRTNLARVHSDGRIDDAFDPGPLTLHNVGLICPAPMGEWLVAGPSTAHPWWAVERVDAQGAPNPEFRANFGRLAFTYHQPIRQVAVQADGRILIAGPFVVSETAGGIVRRGVVRLFPDGRLDPTWDLGTVTGDDGVMDLAQAADGRIVVVGDFTHLAGQPRRHVARLTASGQLDPSFFTANLDEFMRLSHVGIRDIRLHHDGSMIVVPKALSRGGTALYVARLRPDGNVDPTFQANYLEDNAHALALQRDGKVLISENRSSEGLLQGWLRRRTAAGPLDNLFPPNFPPWSFDNGIVRALAVQPDGRIVVAGRFTLRDARGMIRHGLVRLNPLYLVEPEPSVRDEAKLRLIGEPNRHYEVLESSDLEVWTVITNFVSTNDVTTVRDGSSGLRHRTYTARQLDTSPVPPQAPSGLKVTTTADGE